LLENHFIPRIRHAIPADAMELSALAEQTFREAFRSTNTVEDMDMHCRARYGEAIQRTEISNPAMVTLLCESDGSLIAFAQLRWPAAPDCVPAQCPGEIQRFYVSASWHGKGVAHDLMTACIEEIEKRQFDVVWLGVWEHNPRAIAFYQKFGFREVGSHVFPLGTDPQRDLIMVRPVSSFIARAKHCA
jgi:ribosomal protein S18 acetylase RimI-like enzyme